jgi:hypothetical protein
MEERPVVVVVEVSSDVESADDEPSFVDFLFLVGFPEDDMVDQLR